MKPDPEACQKARMVFAQKTVWAETVRNRRTGRLGQRLSSMRQLIIRGTDQLAAGEISLIGTTPEDAGAAKARLDNHRKSAVYA